MSNKGWWTNAGLVWNAANTNGDDTSPITEMAFGDGERIPTLDETALENERYRTTIVDHGVEQDGKTNYFDASLEDCPGGFEIREIGLFTEDGTMVAVARRGVGLALHADDNFTYGFLLFNDQAEVINVQIDPLAGVSPNRRIDTGDGLSGGGSLDQDRKLKTDWSYLDEATQIGDDDTFNIRRLGKQLKIKFSTLKDFVLASLPWATNLQFNNPATTGKVPQVAQIHNLINEAIEAIEFPEDTVLTTEQVQDIVGNFISGQGATVIYDDAGNVLSIEAAYATADETIAAIIGDKAVTPAGLKALTATTERPGLAERATDVEADDKTDNVRFVTPYHLGEATKHLYRPVAEILVKGKGTSSSNQSEAPSATIIHNLGVAGLVATAVNEGGSGGTTRLDLTWDNAGEVVNSDPFGVAEGEDFSSLTAMTYTDGRGNIIRAQNIDDPGTPEMRLGTSFTAVLYARA